MQQLKALAKYETKQKMSLKVWSTGFLCIFWSGRSSENATSFKAKSASNAHTKTHAVNFPCKKNTSHKH